MSTASTATLCSQTHIVRVKLSYHVNARCRYNLLVIGAGSGGLVTAAGSAGVGARVALIEDHLMGGDCLNYGCVPSKALIRCARAVHEAR